MSNEMEDQPSRSFQDYWAIIRRRRWWIFVPLFLCWAGIWAGSWFLPATYRSEALIVVEQQQVPEQYVASNVSVSLEDRLQTMTQQILSRTRLQTTIDRFHLYPPSRGSSNATQAQDSIEQMRNDIKIDLVESPVKPGELTAFKISYTSASPELAQQVNSELTSLFIDENLKAQQQLSESTTAFLQSQLTQARIELEQQEAKVRAFKVKHLGDLPSQLQSNVGILTGLESQLLSIEHSLDEAKQQKLYLESLLEQYQSVQASLGVGNSTATSSAALDKDLLDLRHRLSDARSRYTDDYPDVVALKDEIERTEKLRDNQENAPPTTSTQKHIDVVPAGTAQQVQLGAPTSIMQIQSQQKANELEIQNYEHHQKDIEAQISELQARLNMTPETEQELAEITRGYDESKANYDSLLIKQNQSQLATSLEQRQQGQQFRIIDPPSLPKKPSSPDHFRISLAGLAFGAIIGASIAALLELVNVRIRQEKDLDGVTSARILVSIPHLTAPGEDRFRAFFRSMELMAALTILILIVAGNFYAFYKG